MNTQTAPRLLVVDDEPDLRTLYELTLVREGYDVECAGSVEEAWTLLLQSSPGGYQLLITDMRLPDGTGLDLLHRIEAAGRPEKGIVITAYGSAENAVEALKAGAYDYLTKPVDLRHFRAAVASALGRPVAAKGPPGVAVAPGTAAAGQPAAAAAARGPAGTWASAGAAQAAPAPAGQAALQRMAGESPAMQQVRALVEKVARSMAPVLVHGESGTGKELVARAIHAVSARAAQPFVAVNCGAIPENLLEAEFFGYRKGAFTGAQEDREGYFQAAQGGTLFLDEIGDLPLAMQSKLLRVVQERMVRPLGGVAEVPLNVRLVSASHKDLGAEVLAGRFRQDLFYRLNVIRVTVPPLRERMADLPQICAAVLERIARDAGVVPVPTLQPDALQRLQRYGFPGNVRELENLLHRAVAMASGSQIGSEDLGLPAVLLDDAADATQAAAAEPSAQLPARAGEPARVPLATGVPEVPQPEDLAAYLDQVERRILQAALQRYRYNRTAAGASLGLSLRQMRYRMARLGVGADTVPDHGPERGETG